MGEGGGGHSSRKVGSQIGRFGQNLAEYTVPYQPNSTMSTKQYHVRDVAEAPGLRAWLLDGHLLPPAKPGKEDRKHMPAGPLQQTQGWPPQ